VTRVPFDVPRVTFLLNFRNVCGIGSSESTRFPEGLVLGNSGKPVTLETSSLTKFLRYVFQEQGIHDFQESGKQRSLGVANMRFSGILDLRSLRFADMRFSGILNR
jgi:hypothetical protein